jgi:glycosyltransferase involved in cell wall biosynthesis
VTKSRRLVFHIPALIGGGAERVCVLIANEMARRGHEVTLFVWNGQGPNRELVDGRVRLVSLDLAAEHGRFGKILTLKGVFRTILFLRREQPDAVFSALDFANALMAVALLFARSRALFFPSYHAASQMKIGGFAYSVVNLLDRVTARRSTKAISVSNGIGQDLVQRDFEGSRVVTIYNPLPSPARRSHERYAWEDKLAEMGEGPVIITLGRLVAVKDHRTLLEAFSRLDPSRGARLVLFGDGPLRTELQDYAQSLGLSERVLFAGYVNDPAACYAAGDLFVLSSRTEGFGNVLVEALAAGIPIVSTDAPHGPREILKDGTFGTLVPVADPGALAQAMTSALDASHDIEALKRRSRDFDVTTIGEDYERLLAP